MKQVQFFRVDSWNRPVFVDDDLNFYGSLDKLFNYDASKEEVCREVKADDLVFFGCSFDCEPDGFSCEVEIVDSISNKSKALKKLIKKGY